MESNWRSDVWRLGLNGGWPGELIAGLAYGNLIAYSLDPGPPFYWIMNSNDPDYFWFIADFGGDQGYRAVSFATVPSTNRRFPYGRNVAPD